MIEIKDLSLSAGNFRLRDISFAIEGYTVLLGPTGAGKSLLIDAIAGLRKIDSGDIIANGQSLNGLDTTERGIGILLQDGRLFPHLNVRKNLEFPYRIRGQKPDYTLIELYMQKFKIKNLLDRSVRTLSGGERQRVALLRSLLAHPRALLLDEPLSGIDPSLRLNMQKFLKDIKKMIKVPVLHVTHDFDEAYYLADTIAIINKGKIEQIGSAKAIFRHPRSVFVANFVEIENFIEITGIENNIGRTGKTIIYCDINIGEKKIFTLRADEIIVSKEKFQSSARNFIEMSIETIIDNGRSISIELKREDLKLKSYITKFSLENMNLTEGEKVFAVFKAKSLHALS